MRVRFFDPNAEYVTLSQLFDWVRSHPLPDGRLVPVFLWGGSGVGKTQIIKNYCKEKGIGIKTYAPAHDVDGQGIVGIPVIDEETGKTKHSVPEHIPTEVDGEQGIWFIDEINRGNEAVLAGLMEPIGEGTIAQSGWELPPGWILVAAANPRESGYQVRELDEAMLNRAIHYAPGWDGPNWSLWAEGAGVDSDIIDFALASESHVNSGEHQLPQELQEKLKPSPRTLTYLAALYEPGMPDGLLEVITDGLLNRAAATQFRDFVKLNERPITYSDAMVDDDDKYDELIIRFGSWLATINDNSATVEQRQACRLLIRASIMRIIGGLSNVEYQAPEDGEELNESEIIAQRISAFFAMVPQELYDDIWEAVKYSAASWEKPLMRCAIRWNEYWAQQHSQAKASQANLDEENQFGA